MERSSPLTNSERRDDVAFLVTAYREGRQRPTDVLDEGERRRFLAGDAGEQRRLLFKLLCFASLAAQPAPDAVVRADWRRLRSAGVVDDIYDDAFDLRAYATAPPVSRSDSKGKVVDFVRIAEGRSLWEGLLPAPPDGATVIDTLHAASGGALKSRAFWVVREMLRGGLWPHDGAARFAFVPDGRVRKRAARMGLIDLPEKDDSLENMKAVSVALHAVTGLAGNDARDLFDLPVSLAAQRCEVCDAARMATCPLPHCQFRRTAIGEGQS